MVSIRRRRLLGLCSVPNSVSAQPLPLSDGIAPKEETALETAPDSSNLSASASSREHQIHQFPQMKRRKKHRRKHVGNQEPCIMRGVYFKNKKWQAAIKVDKKQIHLGTVDSEEEAARLYDRAAFMCGREPNFQLSEADKQELLQFKWDEFLAVTRSAITNKKSQRRMGRGSQTKPQKTDSEDDDQGRTSFSASEDDTSAP